MSSQDNTRRKFLANVGKTTVAVAASSGVILSQAVASDSKVEKSSSVVKGTSKKVEILYQKTAEWEKYYSRAY